jgi:hypothetical protein
MTFGINRQPDNDATGFDEAPYDDVEVIGLPDGRERVVSFRFDQLVTAGYTRGLARRLAEDLSVDWHRAVDLIRAGCDARTAAAILM